MKFLSILDGLFGPAVAETIARPVQKLAVWTFTHVAGEDKGEAIAQAVAPTIESEAEAITAAAEARIASGNG